MIQVDKGMVNINGDHDDLVQDLAGALFAIRKKYKKEYGSAEIGDMLIHDAMKVSQNTAENSFQIRETEKTEQISSLQDSFSDMLRQAEREGDLYKQEMIRRMMCKMGVG